MLNGQSHLKMDNAVAHACPMPKGIRETGEIKKAFVQDSQSFSLRFQKVQATSNKVLQHGVQWGFIGIIAIKIL